jgi:hypothetical protein
MSYDYEFPEGLRIADINNNRKVGTIDRRFIQSGNNVASGFARPAPFPLGSPAMGGGGSGGAFNIGKTFKSLGSSAVKIAAPVVSKIAQQHLEKALTSMLSSSAESAAAGAGVTGGRKGFKAFARSVVSHPQVKAFASQAVKTIAPHVKAMAENMLNATIQRLSEHGSAGSDGMEGAGFFQNLGHGFQVEGDMAREIATHGVGGKFNIGKTFKKLGSSAVKIASPIVSKIAQQHLEKALTSMLESSAESSAAGAGMTGGRKGFKAFARSVVNHPAVRHLASQAVTIVAPVIKDVANKMLNKAVQMAMGADSGESMEGGSIGSFFHHMGNSIGNVVKDVGTGLATNYVASALMNPVVDEAILEGALVAAPAVAEAAGRRPRGRPRKMAGGSIGSFFKKVGHSIGDVGKSVATGVGTQYLVNALTNPAVDEALAEGAMVALGRRPRGRPRKAAAAGGFSLSNAIHSVTKQVPYGRGKAKGGLVIQNPDGTFRQVNNFITTPKKLFGRGGAALGADPRTYTPMPRKVGGAKSGGAKSGGARGAIVSRIMKERGCSLPQASSIVKSEGLY